MNSVHKPNLVLIHGAFHGAWCWEKLTPLLKDHVNCFSIELPQVQKESSSISLNSYVSTCMNLIETLPSCSILAHSMAGIVLSSLCEKLPTKINHAIYLASIVVENGKSWSDYRSQNINSQVSLALNTQLSTAQILHLDTEKVANVFYNGCLEKDIAFAKKHLKPQTTAPLKETLQLGSNYKQVKKYYLECTQDRALDPTLQGIMHKHSDVNQSFSLDSDHSPFFSMPNTLATLIRKIIK